LPELPQQLLDARDGTPVAFDLARPTAGGGVLDQLAQAPGA